MDLTIALSLAAIIALLILSGFFSGSETAMTAASRAHMHTLAQEGDNRAAMVNTLRQKKERLIGAILLGNNLVNIMASALATSVLITLVGDAAVPVATVVMTLLVLVFAEVLPKTYAIHHSMTTALGVAPAMRIVVFILAPITAAISWFVGVLLKIFTSDFRNVSMTDYVDELRGAIELHDGPEEEIKQERAMLRSILDLADVEVSEIMTHRRNVEAIDADLPAGEAVDAVLQSPFTRLPIWQGDPDNVVGVLCGQDSCGLPPDSIDIAYICDTYHHFEFPSKTMRSIHRALKPGGQVVLVDFHVVKGVSSDFVMGHVRAGQDVFALG